MKRIAELSFTWFMFIFFAFLFVVTWHYAPRARLVPLVFLSLGLILIGLQLWLKYHQQQAASPEREEPTEAEIDAPFHEEMKVLGWYVFLLIILWSFGFMIATPLFLVSFLKGWSKERWVRTLTIAGIFTFLMYLVVQVGFRIILYRGWVFGD